MSPPGTPGDACMSDNDFSQVCLAFGALAVFLGFQTLRRYRIIQNTPTSRIRSMAAGPVELCGRIDPSPTLVSPLTATPCAWWSIRIEKYRGGRSPWLEVAREDSSACPLRLADETGETPLDLTDLAVTPTHSDCKQSRRPHRSDRRMARLLQLHGLLPTRRLRVTEQRVHAGELVFLHGVLRVAGDVAATRGRIARLRSLRDTFADAPAPEVVRAEASNPRALRAAMARRLRALKRESLAETGARRISPAALAELRARARDQVNSERAEASGALARLDALSRGWFDESKAASSEARVAALLLRDPRWAAEAATLVGSDPLGQAAGFLQPGNESQALAAHRWGLTAIAAGVLAISAGLVAFAL